MLINEIYKPFVLNSEVQGCLEKMNNLPKHHGVGPPEACGPIQLHPLKAGPGYGYASHLICHCFSVQLSPCRLPFSFF